MKQKKKQMSVLKRVLLCSWCVLMLVLTFFVIKWAMGLSASTKQAESVDTLAGKQQSGEQKHPLQGGNENGTGVPVSPLPTVTPEPVIQVEFVTEYAHVQEAEEVTGKEGKNVYGLRYPAFEDETVKTAVKAEAEELLAEELARLDGEKSPEGTTIRIDYEDGTAGELVSVLFYVETESEEGTQRRQKTWIYNKKKEETVDADTLFSTPAYAYIGEKAGGEGTVTDFLLTSEGAKFYYEEEEERKFVLIPYVELHTYMAVTVNGTVVADRIRELDPDAPMIAFTFDDGPHYELTPRLLELLEAYDARATFFLLGERVEMTQTNKDIAKQTYDAGHEVGSHTYGHERLNLLSEEELTEELTKARNAIYSAIGEYPVMLRPSYGAHNETVHEYSYAPLIIWNIDSEDWSLKDAEKIAEHVLSEVRDGKILLMHDIHSFSVDAVELILPELKARGYQIVTVQELLYYKGVELINGKAYHSSYN